MTAWTTEESEEINQLTVDSSFVKSLTVADLPPDKTVSDGIRTQWVYDVKLSKPSRHKARMVVDGRDDATTDDTFSPVARTDTFKLVCTAIAQL